MENQVNAWFLLWIRVGNWEFGGIGKLGRNGRTFGRSRVKVGRKLEKKVASVRSWVK